jgi:ribosomal protein L24E
MTVSSLLNVCPKGAWVSEDQAMAFLGAASKQELKQKLKAGELKHVAVEHGRGAQVSSPFSKHRFFFIQKQGTTAVAVAAHPSVGLAQWVTMCCEFENKSHDLPSMDENTIELLQKYTDRSINDGSLENDLLTVYNDLKSAQAIVSSIELSALAEDESDDEGYTYQPPPKASLSSLSGASPHGDGDVYIRADGKKVRRVKRATSSAAVDSKGNSLTSFLDGGAAGGADKGESKLAKMRGSQSVVGDGEVYVRADGKKVRRVRKTPSVVAEPPKESLTSFLDNGTAGDNKPRRTGSASVAGDMLTMDKNTSLTGEVYIRADGKKVRRVKKAPTPEASGDIVEIITRPDGTKVRRITKAKPQEMHLLAF